MICCRHPRGLTASIRWTYLRGPLHRRPIASVTSLGFSCCHRDRSFVVAIDPSLSRSILLRRCDRSIFVVAIDPSSSRSILLRCRDQSIFVVAINPFSSSRSYFCCRDRSIFVVAILFLSSRSSSRDTCCEVPKNTIPSLHKLLFARYPKSSLDALRGS